MDTPFPHPRPTICPTVRLSSRLRRRPGGRGREKDPAQAVHSSPLLLVPAADEEDQQGELGAARQAHEGVPGVPRIGRMAGTPTGRVAGGGLSLRAVRVDALSRGRDVQCGSVAPRERPPRPSHDLCPVRARAPGRSRGAVRVVPRKGTCGPLHPSPRTPHGGEVVKSPAFQFYPNDFLGSGSVAAMTLEEIGAYVLLLCYEWNEGGLPDDLDRLARYCHVQ